MILPGHRFAIPPHGSARRRFRGSTVRGLRPVCEISDFDVISMPRSATRSFCKLFVLVHMRGSYLEEASSRKWFTINGTPDRT
jgi:hypothetical protein